MKIWSNRLHTGYHFPSWSLFFLIFIWILAASIPVNALESAPMNPKFIVYLNDVLQGSYRPQMTPDGMHLGRIPGLLDITHAERLRHPSGIRGDSLPVQYDLRTTGIRDQGTCGACWTFAAFGSMESFLMPTEERDFSEQHLNDNHGFDIPPCQGGFPAMPMAYLTRWDGPIDESDDPYHYGNGAVQKHVQTVTSIPRTKYTFYEIKQAVMNYGAVDCALRWEGSTSSSSTYYNSTTFAYYYYGSDDTPENHEVDIVGWDDSFSRTNFVKTPPGDGAFIVRNSNGASFGDGGYFYLSYYDTYAGYDCWAFRNAETTFNYSDIYQYDTLGWVNSAGYGTSSAWGANIFTAGNDASLGAVGFYASSSTLTYENQIYTGVTAGNPGSGVWATSQSGSLSEIGYHLKPAMLF